MCCWMLADFLVKSHKFRMNVFDRVCRTCLCLLGSRRFGRVPFGPPTCIGIFNIVYFIHLSSNIYDCQMTLWTNMIIFKYFRHLKMYTYSLFFRKHILYGILCFASMDDDFQHKNHTMAYLRQKSTCHLPY